MNSALKAETPPHAPSLTPPKLLLTEISRTFGTGPTAVRALREVDLTFEPGEYWAIVGRSGSGKSTLLNLLGLLDRPTTGEYWVGEANATTLSAKQTDQLRASTFGLIFQSFHLVDFLSVRENVALGLTYTGWPTAYVREQVGAVVEQVGLTHRIDAAASTLSGGERQRVAIARTLARQPTVLLADEPTGNLDEASAEAVLRLFEQVNSSGATVIIITPDPETALRATRRVRVRDGQVQETA